LRQPPRKGADRRRKSVIEDEDNPLRNKIVSPLSRKKAKGIPKGKEDRLAYVREQRHFRKKIEGLRRKRGKKSVLRSSNHAMPKERKRPVNKRGNSARESPINPLQGSSPKTGGPSDSNGPRGKNPLGKSATKLEKKSYKRSAKKKNRSSSKKGEDEVWARNGYPT